MIRRVRAAGPMVLIGAGIGSAMALGTVAAITILVRVFGHVRKYLPNGDSGSLDPAFSRGDSVGLILIGVAVAAASFVGLWLYARHWLYRASK